MVEIGADAVHLVDERDARHAILVRLTPYRFRLRLHAGNRIEHRNRAIQHAQRPLDFHGEIHVARRVDDIDAICFVEPLPGSRRRRGRNRDPALALLLHPVHHGSAFVHFADLVSHTRVEQDALGAGRLPRIDVRHDPDVADLIELYLVVPFSNYSSPKPQAVTSDSARKPCSLPPCGARLLSSSPRRRGRWRRPRFPRPACPSSTCPERVREYSTSQ